MHEDRLPQLGNSPKRQPALHLAHQYRPQRGTKFSPWWLTLILGSTVAALVSASLLAYFLLRGQGTGLQGQPLQVEQQQPQGQASPQEAPAQVSKSEQPPATQQANPEPEPWSGPPPPVPNDAILLTLIRSTLTALWQANLTGNYSVLRDMGSRAFKDENSVEGLAQLFARLRKRNIDISAILLVQPKLYREPEIGPKGNLVIRGFFPTKPALTNFNLVFQPLRNGRWQLLFISVRYAAWPQKPAAEAAGTSKPAAPEKNTEQGTPAKPPVPRPASKPKPTGASESAGTAKKKASEEVDIRDRIDLAPPSPQPEEPKRRSFWNPFER